MAGCRTALNPYFKIFGERRPVAAPCYLRAPARTTSSSTRARYRAGRKFQFRFWENDKRPPKLTVLSSRHGTIIVSATDTGSGVDPRSLSATIDGHESRTFSTRAGC